MNRPRFDDTLRRQNATKNKVRPTLRGSTRSHTYQLLRLVRDKSSYIGEEKEGTTPDLGLDSLRPHRARHPHTSVEVARTICLGLLPACGGDADLVREEDRQTIAVAQR
jgi:hypothetical protein